MKIQRNGYAKDEEKYSISHNPQDVVLNLFGNGFKIQDIDTFQKAFQIVKNNQKFKYKNLSLQILKQCAKSLKQKQERLEFPKELEEYII